MDKNKKDKLILLIVPKYTFASGDRCYNYVFPLGLGYISAVLKKEGYSVDCLNLNHHDGTVRELVHDAMNKKNYDFICTGSNALSYASIEAILNSVREHKSKPYFILGGPIITSEPELIFKALKPDFGVIGEGEETILELIEGIEKKKELKKIPGIVFEDNGKFIFTGVREPIKDIEKLPWPDFEGLEFEKQIDHAYCNDYYYTQAFDYPRAYPILGSRGCPFNCTFCYHYEKYRARPIGDIMKEIENAVKRYKINTIAVYDECFAIDKKRIYEFCSQMKKLKEKVPWDIRWTSGYVVSSVDKEILKVLKEAGCDTISYGFESFSQKVLKSMKKPITPEMISKAFYATIEAGIGIQAYFIFGDVAETKETAKETLDWWKKNCKGQVGLSSITPYPSSEIYKHCVRKGIIKNKLHFIKTQIIPGLGLWLNMTDKMSDKEMNDLKKEVLNASGKYYKFIKPISKKKIRKHVYEFTTRCPFCREIKTYKNCYVNNGWAYGFYLICRNCHMRYFVVSHIQKIAYEHYSLVRGIRDVQKRVFDFLKKKRL